VNVALYYPWPAEDSGWVPPCGHVAGIVSRVDRTRGVHHAPANVVLEGVRDVERAIDDVTQATLRAGRVNCLRAFPARGVRVWDAVTLSRETEWEHLNVRRLVTTLARWIAQTTRDVAFEPNTPETWERVRRAVTAHLDELYRLGALAGASPDEAYAVDCDERTNPPQARAAGRLAVDVRVAPAAPIEVIAVRIVRHVAGVTVEPVTD
jgi:phage tail sheath protein FI